MRLGFIGLGKLGLPCAEEMATQHEVCGYDISTSLSSENARLKIVRNFELAVQDKDLIFVAVPTPHDSRYDGSAPVKDLPLKDFGYGVVQEVLSQIHKLAPKSTVVLISTVLPGTVRHQLSALLPQGTLIYNPYFIAMGTVKDDFLNPEMLPIGTSDGSVEPTVKLQELYRSLLSNPPFVFGTWEEMESVKIFYNTFISFKLSFVNMIQDVAQRIGNTNVDVVTGALVRANQRILSPAYMKAGMGDGGPCHPRDNIALRELAQRLNLGYDLFGSIIESREVQAKHLAEYLCSFKKPVCIVGIGFKPKSALVDGSYSLLVASYVKEFNSQLFLYDPLAGYNDAPSEAVTYLLGHPYEDLPKDFKFIPGSTIVDPWRSAPAFEACTLKRYGDTRGE